MLNLVQIDSIILNKSPQSTFISETQIKGQHLEGHPHYSNFYRRTALRCNSSQNWHGVIITLCLPSNLTSLVTYKGRKTIICMVVHHSPPSVAIHPYNVSSLFCNIKNVCSMTWIEKKPLHLGGGYRGASSIIYVGRFNLLWVRKWTVHTMSLLWNFSFWPPYRGKPNSVFRLSTSLS